MEDEEEEAERWMTGKRRGGDKNVVWEQTKVLYSGDLTEGEEEWELRTLFCVVSIKREHGTIDGLPSKAAPSSTDAPRRV